MNKKERLRELVETLLSKQNKYGYTRKDIEVIIIGLRGVDRRTINNWFNALWSLDYIVQAKPNQYFVNMTRAAELDINVKDISPLEEYTHTFSSGVL